MSGVFLLNTLILLFKEAASLADFFAISNGGVILTALGVAVAVFMAGMGSAKGCSLVGETATGVITEEPEKFGKALILQLLPGTQGLYGFIIGFLIALNISGDLSLTQGAYLFMASLPVGIVGYISAIYQGKVAASGLQILAKNPDHNTKGIILSVVVETYAILGFVASIVLLFVTYGNFS